MKIKCVTAIIILASACATITHTTTAQRHPQRRATRPATPKATPTATPTPLPSPTPTPTPEGTLQIEAGLVFKSGDVKPVARTVFYLLDAEPGEILKDGGVKTSMKSFQNAPPDAKVLLFNLALAINGQILPENAEFVKAAMPVLQPHIVQTVTTDFSGKAQFSAVKIGTYYLTGFAEVGRASVTWNLKITLGPGPTTIVLDNNNALELHNR